MCLQFSIFIDSNLPIIGAHQIHRDARIQGTVLPLNTEFHNYYEQENKRRLEWKRYRSDLLNTMANKQLRNIIATNHHDDLVGSISGGHTLQNQQQWAEIDYGTNYNDNDNDEDNDFDTTVQEQLEVPTIQADRNEIITNETDSYEDICRSHIVSLIIL